MRRISSSQNAETGSKKRHGREEKENIFFFIISPCTHLTQKAIYVLCADRFGSRYGHWITEHQVDPDAKQSRLSVSGNDYFNVIVFDWVYLDVRKFIHVADVVERRPPTVLDDAPLVSVDLVPFW